jgi:hypothetical protein
MGNFQLTVLSDVYGDFPATQPTWPPEATTEDLKRALESAFCLSFIIYHFPVLATLRKRETDFSGSLEHGSKREADFANRGRYVAGEPPPIFNYLQDIPTSGNPSANKL